MNGYPHPQLGNCLLARAYVCPQTYTERFNPLVGLCRGTIFPELVSEYEPEEDEQSKEAQRS